MEIMTPLEFVEQRVKSFNGKPFVLYDKQREFLETGEGEFYLRQSGQTTAKALFALYSAFFYKKVAFISKICDMSRNTRNLISQIIRENNLAELSKDNVNVIKLKEYGEIHFLSARQTEYADQSEYDVIIIDEVY